MKNYLFYYFESNKKLGEEIAAILRENNTLDVGTLETVVFADGEYKVRALDDVEGKNIIFLESTNTPVNDRALSAMIFADGLKRAGAKDITFITPYFGYSRQDRVASKNDPITLKLITNLYKESGIDRIISVDPHARYEEGFFKIPVLSLTTEKIFAAYFEKQLRNQINSFGDIVILAPDHGSVNRGVELQKCLPGSNFASIEKARIGINKIKTISFNGDVQNKIVIIYDDIVDTGQTVFEAIRIAYERGAKGVYVAVSHPVFSSHSQDVFSKAKINGLVVTNSIEAPILKSATVLSLAETIAEYIQQNLVK